MQGSALFKTTTVVGLSLQILWLSTLLTSEAQQLEVFVIDAQGLLPRGNVKAKAICSCVCKGRNKQGFLNEAIQMRLKMLSFYFLVFWPKDDADALL